jgi:hypothetical protein
MNTSEIKRLKESTMQLCSSNKALRSSNKSLIEEIEKLKIKKKARPKPEKMQLLDFFMAIQQCLINNDELLDKDIKDDIEEIYRDSLVRENDAF